MSIRPIAADASKLDAAASALPIDARMPRGALTMAWWSVCSAMFYLFLGATLALTYGTRNALVGMVLSVIVFGFINGTLARYAARTGLSCSALSREMMGSTGAALATALLSATALYYAVFEGSVLAVAMSKVIPGLSYGAAAVVIALYSVPLIFGSVQHWLNRFNAVLLPFYLIGLVSLVLLSVMRHGYSSQWLLLEPSAGVPAFGWWKSLSAYLGVLVFSMCTVDFARFARPEDAEFHARVNFGMPFYVMTFLINGVIGIFLVGTVDATNLTETTVVDASLAILGAWTGLVWVWITQTRINTANYFLSTINLQAFLEEAFGARLMKVACAIAVGVVALILTSVTNVFSYLLTALSYQGVFITAWVGVALSYVLGRTESRDGRMHGTASSAPGGMLAWIAGALAGGILMQFGGDFAALSAPLTLIVSVTTHRAVRRWAPYVGAVGS